jgi:hypothetical protein
MSLGMLAVSTNLSVCKDAKPLDLVATSAMHPRVS